MLTLPGWARQITVGPLQTNAYLLEMGETYWLIDPGGEGSRLATLLPREVDLTVYLTHGHADHWAGLYSLQLHRTGLRWFYPRQDEEMITGVDRRFLSFLGEDFPELTGLPLDAPQELEAGGRYFSLFHLPGHTPGHLAFLCKDYPGGGILFAGDLLFRGGVGRTDLPGGSTRRLQESLSRLLKLPGETVVCPGHGPLTTINAEREMIEDLLA
ncbi:MAG: MBL fold metallo-hydrolase [Coprothermobacterota bacterium]|nr:MBL fold metallo-hydrolase [Coprothermobacterota bacterium]